MKMNDALIQQILEYLKQQYEKTLKMPLPQDTKMVSDQAQYYVSELSYNLIEPMSETVRHAYEEGEGKELDEKMRALRSSSAMTFNLIGNGPVTFKQGNAFFEPGSHRAEFEKKLKTIRNSKRKANLDACLSSASEMIFCEMKMTEWLADQSGQLSANYLDKAHFWDPQSCEAFRQLAGHLIIQGDEKAQNYRNLLKQYDALQMFKHTLGIYNYVHQNPDTPRTVRLVNCIWTLADPSVLSQKNEKLYQKKLEQEVKEFQIFKQAAQPVIQLFHSQGIDFDILLLTFSEFLEAMEKTENQLAYLQRYC